VRNSCASPDFEAIRFRAVLLNRGAHAPLGGEFEKLRGEILKKGELGVNYTQRDEFVMWQIVLCQLYNTGFLSFLNVINRDLRLKLTKLVPSIKTLVDRH